MVSTEVPTNESGGTRNKISVREDLAPSYPQDPTLDPEEGFDFERDISVTQMEEIDRMISELSQQKADESVSDLLERINQWYHDLPASLDSIPKDSLLVKAVYDKCSEEFFDKFLFNFDAEDFEYDYLVERLFEVEEELRKEKSLSRHPVHPPSQCTQIDTYWGLDETETSEAVVEKLEASEMPYTKEETYRTVSTTGAQIVLGNYNSTNVMLEEAHLIKREQPSLDSQDLPWEMAIDEDSECEDILPMMPVTSSSGILLRKGLTEPFTEAPGNERTIPGSNREPSKLRMSCEPDRLWPVEPVASAAKPSQSRSRRFKRSVRNSKITVNHERIQIVWRKPKKKQRAYIHYSRKQGPESLQSRLQKTPRVKAVRKKMKRIDSLKEARTLLFGLCNHRKKGVRRENNLEGKQPLDSLHQERSGLER